MGLMRKMGADGKQELKGARGQGRRRSMEWLKERRMAEEVYWKWRHLEEQLKRNAQAVLLLVNEVKEGDPKLTPKELQEQGQKFFSEMALSKMDGRAWNLTQEIGVKMDKMRLEWEKFREQVRAREEAGGSKPGGVSKDALDDFRKALKLL